LRTNQDADLEQRQRGEWPELGEAIDELVRVQDKRDDGTRRPLF
jgi:hypothetical protein